jgi:hypothetical protein
MLAVVLAGPMGGCGLTDVECTAVGNFSVIVTVSNAQTGERPETALMIILSDGQVADTASYPASVGNPFELGVGLERTGTFSVSVTAAGYAPWTKDNVVVPRNSCGGAVTQRFDARLEPLPG